MNTFAKGRQYDHMLGVINKANVVPRGKEPDSDLKTLVMELRKTNELIVQLISAPDPLREQLNTLLEKLAEPRIVQVTNQVQPTPIEVTNQVQPAPVDVQVTNQVNPASVEVRVQPTPVEVKVQPAPVKVDNRVDVPARPDLPPLKLKVVRDTLGKITGIQEE